MRREELGDALACIPDRADGASGPNRMIGAVSFTMAGIGVPAGLLCTQVGLQPAGRQMLAAAERIVGPEPRFSG